jgi:hypothetical protein
MAAESQLGGARLRAVQHRFDQLLGLVPSQHEAGQRGAHQPVAARQRVVLDASSKTEMWTMALLLLTGPPATGIVPLASRSTMRVRHPKLAAMPPGWAARVRLAGAALAVGDADQVVERGAPHFRRRPVQ